MSETTRNEIPSSITSALVKQQERVYLLHLEKNLVNFIKNSILVSDPQRGSPSYTIHSVYLKNSYYRLLTHQLCQYYNLQHWNNQQNEIVVSGTPHYDYNGFITHVDNPSSSHFTKLSVYMQMEMSPAQNGNSGRSLGPQSLSLSSTSLHRAGSTARQIKLIRKERNDTLSTSLEAELSSEASTKNCGPKTGGDDTDSEIGTVASEMAGMGLNESPQSTGSQESKIESDRASREALYMKVREQIFDHDNDNDNNDSDSNNDGSEAERNSQQEEQDRQLKENGDSEDDVKSESNSSSSSSWNRANQFGPRNSSQEYPKQNNASHRHRTGKGPNQRYGATHNPGMNTRGGVGFVPAYPGMTIPLQYNSNGIMPAQDAPGMVPPPPMVAMYPQTQQQAHMGNGAYFGLQFAPNGYYPGPVLITPMGMPPPSGNSVNGTIAPSLVTPVTGPAGPGMVPGTGMYSYGAGVPDEKSVAASDAYGRSSYGVRNNYDKETERKILNNPYIILPDSTRTKPRKRYTNGRDK